MRRRVVNLDIYWVGTWGWTPPPLPRGASPLQSDRTDESVAGPELLKRGSKSPTWPGFIISLYLDRSWSTLELPLTSVNLCSITDIFFVDYILTGVPEGGSQGTAGGKGLTASTKCLWTTETSGNHAATPVQGAILFLLFLNWIQNIHAPFSCTKEDFDQS